jgi:hypothetical protein
MQHRGSRGRYLELGIGEGQEAVHWKHSPPIIDVCTKIHLVHEEQLKVRLAKRTITSSLTQ